MAKRDSETMRKALAEGAELLKAIGEEDYQVEEYDATMVCFPIFRYVYYPFCLLFSSFYVVYFVTVFDGLLRQYLCF